MKTLSTLVSIYLLGAVAGSASAQDSTDWTGPYASIHVGSILDADDSASDRVLFDTNLDGNFNDTVRTAAGADAFSPGFCSGTALGVAPTSGCSDNESGEDWGLRAGYDWQMNDWVFGVLGEYAAGDVQDSVSAFSTTPARYTLTRDLGRTMALRGRAGYVFGADSRNLLYISAGIVRADVENSFSTSNAVNTFTGNGNHDADGSQWGLGYEFRIGANLSLGIEYLASQLDDEDYRVRAAGPAPATNPFILTNAAGTDFRRSDLDIETETARVTFGWRL